MRFIAAYIKNASKLCENASINDDGNSAKEQSLKLYIFPGDFLGGTKDTFIFFILLA